MPWHSHMSDHLPGCMSVLSRCRRRLPRDKKFELMHGTLLLQKLAPSAFAAVHVCGLHSCAGALDAADDVSSSAFACPSQSVSCRVAVSAPTASTAAALPAAGPTRAAPPWLAPVREASTNAHHWRPLRPQIRRRRYFVPDAKALVSATATHCVRCPSRS